MVPPAVGRQMPRRPSAMPGTGRCHVNRTNAQPWRPASITHGTGRRKQGAMPLAKATQPKRKGQRWVRQSCAMATARGRWACAPRPMGTRLSAGGRATTGRGPLRLRGQAAGRAAATMGENTAHTLPFATDGQAMQPGAMGGERPSHSPAPHRRTRMAPCMAQKLTMNRTRGGREDGTCKKNVNL